LKNLRVLLLLLLTMALPLRGAMAGFVACEGTIIEPAMISGALHDHGTAQAHDAATDNEIHAVLFNGFDENQNSIHSHGDECTQCGATCSSCPFMIKLLPSVAAPMAFAQTAFPGLVAPPPNHPSEGLDRPPRSH